MREIEAAAITAEVAEMCREANMVLEDDIIGALEEAREREEAPAGRKVLQQLLDNASIAAREKVPLCQDTGTAVFFIEWGQEVLLRGGTLESAINEGVRRGYREGYLRKSMVGDPLKRVNTGDNTPAMIHLDLVGGDRVKLSFMPKGGGSENMSALKMLKPADGAEGVGKFVLRQVEEAGPNSCPPLIVGVGIGGTFDLVPLLAKRALLRPVGQPHPDPYYAALEQNILTKINRSGIGPQGFGGRITALAVHVETFATHMASLPVAVNLGCHAYRRATRVL